VSSRISDETVVVNWAGSITRDNNKIVNESADSLKFHSYFTIQLKILYQHYTSGCVEDLKASQPQVGVFAHPFHHWFQEPLKVGGFIVFGNSNIKNRSESNHTRYVLQTPVAQADVEASH
jgi:hypothetical protein